MKADVIIVGAGPAGLSAGIFACRAGLDVLCFEGLAVGGQAALSYDIGNYPGFKSISGYELTDKMREQAESLGLNIIYAEAKKLTKTKTGFSLLTSSGTYTAKKVIIACGSKSRKLNVSNEREFTGRGVSYCASCDGAFFKGKNVAVIGGGDTAVEDVDYLSKLAKKIYLINRSEKFRAGEKEIARIKNYKHVEVLTSSVVKEIIGDDKVTGLKLQTPKGVDNIKVDGVFVAIGYEPDTNFVDFNVDKDSAGYLIVNDDMQTSVKGLYACGDIVSKKFKQVISACADGARAANSCVRG